MNWMSHPYRFTSMLKKKVDMKQKIITKTTALHGLMFGYPGQMKSCSPNFLCHPSICEDFLPSWLWKWECGRLSLNWGLKYLESHPLAFPIISKRGCLTEVGLSKSMWCEKTLVVVTDVFTSPMRCKFPYNLELQENLHYDDADWLTNWSF